MMTALSSLLLCALIAAEPTPKPTFKLVHASNKEGDQVTCIALNESGTLAAFGTDSGRVIIWDLKKHAIARELDGSEAGCWAFAFSRDGTQIAWHDRNGRITVAGINRGSRAYSVGEVAERIYQLRFLADGKELFSYGKDRVVRVWELATESARPKIREQIAPALTCLNHRGNYIPHTSRPIVWDYERLFPWEKEEGKLVINEYGGLLLTSTDGLMNISDDGSVIAINATMVARGFIHLIDRVTGENLGHLNRGVACAFVPPGKLVAVAIYKSQKDRQACHICVYDWLNDVLVSDVGNLPYTTCMACSPNGSLLFSGHSDASVRIWDIHGLKSKDVRRGDFDVSKAKLPSLHLLHGRELYKCLWEIAASNSYKEVVKEIRESAARHHIPDPTAMKQALRDLQSDVYKKREAASRWIRGYDVLAIGDLENALEGAKTLENRRRIEALIREAQKPDKEFLLLYRHLQILNYMQRPEAYELLREIAQMRLGPFSEEAMLATKRYHHYFDMQSHSK